MKCTETLWKSNRRANNTLLLAMLQQYVIGSLLLCQFWQFFHNIYLQQAYVTHL